MCVALNTYSINGSRHNSEYSLVHHLTFEPRTPRSSALTLAVQHVAATAEKDQEQRQTPTPSLGPSGSHHTLLARCCGSVLTLRRPLGAANSWFHLVAEGPNSVRPRLCFAAATLSEKISKRGLNRSQHQQLRAFPVKPRSELREFSAVTAHQLPAMTSQHRCPKLGTGGGRGGGRGGGVASQRGILSLTSLVSRYNDTMICTCCVGAPVVLSPVVPHFHLDWLELGINSFKCVLHLPAYSLLSTSNPRVFGCVHWGICPADHLAVYTMSVLTEQSIKTRTLSIQ